MIKTKKKRCCRGWEVDKILEEFQQLKNSLKYLQETVTQNTLTIYSADNDIAIGMTGKWHRIVCNYIGDRCEGGVRPHWMSTWDIKEDGYHLRSFVDQSWKGWHGQYSKSELRYDELPRDILLIHHNALNEHLKKLSIWYPCHIYNDFTGEIHRP